MNKVHQKKERIIGLVIGLIGLVVLFHLNFEIGFRLNGADYSTVAHISYDIIKFLNDGWMGSEQRDFADYLYWLIYLIYVLFVWFYRACIGYWVIKSIRVFYNKI